MMFGSPGPIEFIILIFLYIRRPVRGSPAWGRYCIGNKMGIRVGIERPCQRFRAWRVVETTLQPP